MSGEQDYVLGTHDEEIARLALQHRVWRPRVLDAWKRAGFTVGQTLVDVGCGPGNASFDLAEIVGRGGRVVAIDRSRRFLDALEATRRQRDLDQVETLELDLDHAPLPALDADGAWVRWVFAFVRQPRELLARVRDTLRPGGVLVIHEYLDYSTWRTAPRSPEHEEFVVAVMKSWRASGGEPDVGLDLPRWLAELEFEVTSLTPILEVLAPSSYGWQWPRAFLASGLGSAGRSGAAHDRARRRDGAGLRRVRGVSPHPDDHPRGDRDRRTARLKPGGASAPQDQRNCAPATGHLASHFRLSPPRDALHSPRP